MHTVLVLGMPTLYDSNLIFHNDKYMYNGSYFVHTFQDEKITGCWILVSKVGIIIDVSARSRCGLLSKYWSSRRCNPRGLYLGPEDMKPLLVCPNGPLCTPPHPLFASIVSLSIRFWFKIL